MNVNHREDKAREGKGREPYFDLNKVDYEWVEKCRSVKDLKAALKEPAAGFLMFLHLVDPSAVADPDLLGVA